MGIQKVIAALLVTILSAVGFFNDFYLPWSLNWGATDAEIHHSMPGDELLQNSSFSATRAVTIRAQPEEIWAWIIQMGYKKAGFYSYDRLDNDGIPSPERIIPEYQGLKVGDRIPMSTALYVEVVEMNPYESMLWVFQEEGGPFSNSTWACELYRLDDQNTRMVTRLRVDKVDAVGLTFMEIGEIFMMRKCMLGIKQRSERNALPN